MRVLLPYETLVYLMIELDLEAFCLAFSAAFFISSWDLLDIPDKLEEWLRSDRVPADRTDKVHDLVTSFYSLTYYNAW